MPIRFAIGRPARVVVAILAGLVAIDARGETAPLTLEQALERAVAGNPALRGSEYLLQASRARELRAAQSPAYTLGAEFEDFAGSGSLSGTDALQTTLRLSGVLELGGRRDARIAFAQSETDAAAIEQRAQRLDLLADVASRFTDVAARQEVLSVAEEADRLAAQTVEQVRERIRIGAAPDYELWRAEIQVSRAAIEREHAEHELASARVRLTATWGATEPEFERVSAELFELPGTHSFEQLKALVDGSPAIQRMLSRERLAAARMQLAEITASREIGWSGGVRHIESLGDTALVASVSVPFGARRRAEPAIREAEALRSHAALEIETTRVAAMATLYELYQELLHARTEADALRTTVRPKSEGVLRSTERAFQLGRTTFLELANAQKQLLEVGAETVAAAARYHGLLIEIERLTGAAMAADVGITGESP
jgi:cobalt-zinc-cadmium efflux system outer membrane protein